MRVCCLYKSQLVEVTADLTVQDGGFTCFQQERAKEGKNNISQLVHTLFNTRHRAFTATEPEKIFCGKNQPQLCTKASCFGDHLHLHHQGNAAKFDR